MAVRFNQKTSKTNVVSFILLGVLTVVIIAALFVWPTMLVVGALAPTFGLSTLSFWQTAGVMYLISIAGALFSKTGAPTSNKV